MRRLLALIAVPVALTACSSGSSSGGAPAAVSGGDQSAAIKALAHGTLKGPSGSITFNADGTASAVLADCGTGSGSTLPFGVDCSTPNTPVTGKFSADAHELRLTAPDNAATVYEAYVDGAGKLHIGTGTIGTLSADRQGDIKTFAGSLILHVHGTCTYEDVSGTDVASKPSPCHFGTQNGVQVLVATVPDEFDKTKTSDLTLVYDPKVGIVMSPTLWYSVLNPA